MSRMTGVGSWKESARSGTNSGGSWKESARSGTKGAGNWKESVRNGTTSECNSKDIVRSGTISGDSYRRNKKVKRPESRPTPYGVDFNFYRVITNRFVSIPFSVTTWTK